MSPFSTQTIHPSLAARYHAAQTEVQLLCQMYAVYQSISAQIEQGKHVLTIVYQNHESAPTHIQSHIASLEQLRSTLSDAMTFSDPLVWIQYKRIAYADTPGAIRTVGNFMDHCSVPDHICAKRFAFLDMACLQQGGQGIAAVFLPDTPLQLLEVHPTMSAILMDTDCMNAWRSYEYYHEEGRAKKWKQWEG